MIHILVSVAPERLHKRPLLSILCQTKSSMGIYDRHKLFDITGSPCYLPSEDLAFLHLFSRGGIAHDRDP
jgi:hypothetical protein